jgi:hypothetical protein
MTYGIPIVYYGTEAKLQGGADPLNREVFDFTKGYDQTLAKYLRTLNAVRRKHETYEYEPEFRYLEKDLAVITKGPDLLVVVTNTENVHQTLFIERHQFKPGDIVCNAFSEWDCIQVDDGKRLKVTIVHGHPKVYVRAAVTEKARPWQ